MGFTVNTQFRLGEQFGHKAAADMRKVVELQPTVHFAYHMLATLLVADRDIAGYRQLCQKMLLTFSATTNDTSIGRMATDCLILPSSGADLQQVGTMAEALTQRTSGIASLSPMFPWWYCSKALADYREGHFASAGDWAQRSIDYAPSNSNAQYCYAEAYMTLAMAEFQLKHRDHAVAALAKGVQVANQTQIAEIGDSASDWPNWIITHALLDEAKALVESQPPLAEGHDSLARTNAMGSSSQTP
jgi:tetratricopeptide (TPR) repeat protein